MERDIRRQKIRMLITSLGILGLLVWNLDFVINGIMSNIYLNGTIILVFLFGFALVFRHVFDLEGEQVALRALKEAFSDAKVIEEKDFVDEYWRHHRCMAPAIVYERPKLLGHIFELTYDEILRTNKIRITLTTMQSLVDGIDTRMAEQRSLTNYITGLLVFLGLIGTFIGLMDMVASVGGIIGSLASATGEGADQAGAFAKLVQDLKGPLVGMATGFSSSLFGLFGSLMLGLLSRFGARASNSLKLHFEEWLAGVAQIENEEYVPEERDLQGPLDEKNLKRLTGSVIALTEGFEKVNNDFLRTLGMVQSMADAQIAQNKLIEAQTERLESLAQMQHLLVGLAEHMQALMSGFEKSANENRAHNAELRTEVADSFRSLSTTLRDLSEASARERRDEADERKTTMQMMAGLQGSMKDDLAALSETLETLARSSHGLQSVMSGLAGREDRLVNQAESHHRELISALVGLKSGIVVQAQPVQHALAPQIPSPAASHGAGPSSGMPVQAPLPAGNLSSRIEALEAALKEPSARAEGEADLQAIEAQLQGNLMQMAEDMQAAYSTFARDVKEAETRRKETRDAAPERQAMSPIDRLRALYSHRKG